MFYRILIGAIVAVSLLGCQRRVTIYMMTPEHVFRILKGSTLADPNGSETKVMHNGWFYSDLTMDEIELAETE